MKKLIVSASLIAITLFFAGCATSYPRGSFFTNIQLPVAVTDNDIPRSSKKGTAYCESFLGLFASGDASIQTAAENGGITKITHIDWDVDNILGFYGKYTVTVYGE